MSAGVHLQPAGLEQVNAGATISGEWRFSTNTTEADPGSGRFRYDSAVYATVTEIFISETTFPGTDVSNILGLLNSGDRIYIQELNDGTTGALWDITGPPVDNGSWISLPVSLVTDAGGGIPSNNAQSGLVLMFGAGAGSALGWVEFVAQSANPGSVPADTLYMDDGTNFDANTLVWDTNPAAFAADFSVGPVGTEQGGINVNGAAYDAVAKINGVGGALDALLILHRHSTTIPPILTYARTNDETVGHTAVTLGQTLGSQIFTGWTGSHYDIGAVIDVRVSPTGTVSATSLPAEIALFTTPDGSDAASLAMLIGSDQVIYGGINAGDILTLQGAQNTPDVGRVEFNSPVEINYDTFSNTTPAEQFALRWQPAIAASGAYIGGFLTVAPTVTITTATFIPATFSDTSNMLTAANPGFSAFTFINELAVIRNSGNFNLMNGLVMNIGLTHERNTSGTSTVALMGGVSFSPQTRATVSGAIITKTSQVALRVSPTFSTVAGSTANLGVIIGVQMNNPAVALFQPGGGAESATAIYGLVMNAMAFGGNITKAAVLSGLAFASNSFVILNTGTAQSDFGAGSAHWDDNAGCQFGGLTNAANDVIIYWNSVNNAFRTQFALNTSSFYWSNPSSNRFLMNNTGLATTGEYNFNCARFSLGAQTGANGNQVGNFVAPTRSVAVGGDWSDFLLTQAGNITVNAAMGALAGWTINAPSITLGTGSVTTGIALNVGGNPNQGTNRIGVRIISNPSGGGGINAALWVTAGLSRFDGRVDINNGIALGGGAIATLGTIGGSGPTAAAQAQWLEVDIGGVAHWIPVWT